MNADTPWFYTGSDAEIQKQANAHNRTVRETELKHGDIHLFPTGRKMWDGTKFIPCDGTNGTPDLIPRPITALLIVEND